MTELNTVKKMAVAIEKALYALIVMFVIYTICTGSVIAYYAALTCFIMFIPVWILAVEMLMLFGDQ